MGHRRDHRSADQIRQDRRHRRCRALPHSRSAEGELQGLGARLRTRRLPASGCDARPKPRFGRDHCAVGGGGREILSRDVLVFDAPYPCSGPISGHRRNRQRNSALPEDPRRLDRYDQKLLPIMPCARQREHSRAAREGTRRFRKFHRHVGAPPSVGPGNDRHGCDYHAAGSREGFVALRRLDGSDRQGRIAVVQAVATDRPRAQHGRQSVGLGRAHHLHA